MKYHVTVAGRTYEIEVDGHRVQVDGRQHHAEVRPVPGTPLRLLFLDGASWIYSLELSGRGVWTFQQWGERDEVEVVDERTRHIRTLVGAGTGHAGQAALKAPMPGLVARILVEPGQLVDSGQGLVVLEAMKMENELKAVASGVVRTVEAVPGQAVEKGQVLMTFVG